MSEAERVFGGGEISDRIRWMATEIARLVDVDAVQRGVPQPDSLGVVGIRTGGAHLARRLCEVLRSDSNRRVDFGLLDITLYRDDVATAGAQLPSLRGTEIDFDVSGKPVVLVDDVLFTGRTIRAAMGALTDLGRPARVWLAVLVDRGLRELPIAADVVGYQVASKMGERIDVEFTEGGAVEDAVLHRRRKGG